MPAEPRGETALEFSHAELDSSRADGGASVEHWAEEVRRRPRPTVIAACVV